ncbi:conserved domain protein [Paraprevotella xylaniphila YIT 11841]|uniref:Conserved domain protein n=1 Tax=Paraprevotella xylaniphila YIT 11841 TaxID=762982 RepID=F3QSK4_9BACT|nr:phage integrase SAM-like domain-containing protein [Paraprevotella xylaniphila]EGG55291.1 conserved domain protein [Paraprevotella xylaniphila YIT 11841]
MATFKATIKKDKQRSDKTWNVLIRFTHERKVRYISTTMYVTKKDLTASFKIKNQQVIDKCDDLIRIYRDKVNKLNLEINSMDIDSVIDYLKSKDDKSGIDFIAFSRKWCAAHTEIKGIRNYLTALNSLCMFFGRETILCSEITVQKLKEYEEYLSDKKRAQSLYPSAILRLFMEARNYYNDEDNDIIRIKQNLSKYKPKQQNVAEKRALSVEEIRNVFNIPYTGIKVRGMDNRRDLAKDCFMLSFCLMGMNSADLYNATEYDGEHITYYRTKTKDRRNDNAKMIVKVHPIIKPLIEKYRGKERVFNFYERFSSMGDLNRSINIGLKGIGRELGIDNLQFYSARHSMATIAINKVGINKYIVNDMLCHVDSSMRITDLYIQKDFAPVNDANFKLIEYMFG